MESATSFVARITPIEPGTPETGLPGRPGRPPGRPGHGLPLPPLPGVWPKPGEPSLPIELPDTGGEGGEVTPPIFIPIDPQHPIVLPPGITLPPGVIWPPIPPDLGLAGKTAILIWVVGEGFHWFIFEPMNPIAPPIPPATPK